MSLYHKKFGLPTNYRHPMATVEVRWTRHAINAAQSDRYGSVDIVKSINLKEFETIEVEILDGKITKILVRGPFDKHYDVTYALIPIAGRPWIIKTVWKNIWDDEHRLGKSWSKYVKP